MKRYLFGLILSVWLAHDGLGQVQFVDRLEVETKSTEDNFMLFPYGHGVLAFRTNSEKGMSYKQRFEYFMTDSNLEYKRVNFFDVPDFHDLTGFDLEGESIYLLFTRSGNKKDQVIFHLDLRDNTLAEYQVKNTLNITLQEFFMLDGHGVFMGQLEGRPVVQLYNFEEDRVFTLPDIYANDAQIIQMRKDDRLKVFDVVVSRKDRFKKKIITVLTFDTEGDKLREVKIDKLDDPKTEILEAVLTPVEDYQQAMFGSFGLRKRENYKGVFFANINEFGEYSNSYYTLEDFSNFYNYLPEKNRKRKNKSVERAIEKNKDLTIPNVIATREVIALDEGYLIYNDYFSPSTNRYHAHRNNFGAPVYLNHHQRAFPFMGYGGGGFYPRPEHFQFKYLAAQFMFVDHSGRLIWDNSLSLSNTIMADDGKFGQVAFDGRDLFYLYLDKEKLKLSHLRDGELLLDNEEFSIELIDESQRIRHTEDGSLSLMWWYDNYFLLSGKQRIRFMNESNREEGKNVFFVTKIRVDGNPKHYVQY